MDQIEAWIWVMGMSLFFLGIAAGFALGRVNEKILRKRNAEKELAKMNKDFLSYRGEVSQHFVTTAQLVNELSKSYKAVFDHLAVSAQHLCGDQLAEALEFQRQNKYVHATKADMQPANEIMSNESDAAAREDSPKVNQNAVKAGSRQVAGENLDTAPVPEKPNPESSPDKPGSATAAVKTETGDGRTMVDEIAAESKAARVKAANTATTPLEEKAPAKSGKEAATLKSQMEKEEKEIVVAEKAGEQVAQAQAKPKAKKTARKKVRKAVASAASVMAAMDESEVKPVAGQAGATPNVEQASEPEQDKHATAKKASAETGKKVVKTAKKVETPAAARRRAAV